ncbi:hypothetical protein [Phenylobacterium kunshanense]|uniref:DUF3108 domain-containing protein n=1 Tax=Phenylobacterium kunshanense TaxID=1445034 RepID=A0A328BIE3_9CAUL|nr:hypothetical protein [Phenylobacterium kunshanense]RAK67252.1 hypothetical protein DJ019_04795 [Phenylobacterium kunshanense]
MRSGLLALALVAVASPAAAQMRAAVEVRTRPDAVGDLYRYRSESKYAETNADGSAHQSNTQVFDLEVLGVESDGLKLRYTLREASLTDTSGPAMERALKALIGIPLDFQLRADGALVGLSNWEAFKVGVLKAVDAALPANDPIRLTYHQRFGQAPMYAAQDMVLGDVRLLAIMEPKGAVPVGMSEVTDDRRTPPGRALSDVKELKPGCTVRIVRAAVGRNTGIRQDFTTEATLSVRDGRVIALTQRRIEEAPGASVNEQVTIRRVSPTPAC